ncbi:hypothetical protein H8S20_19580 [Clostridium sp. NSJ-6]|uniref:Uncharacterized protein n=1 Tax=Clostridium hominis TaxID=2763036 RepID=A0ABR7DHV8_9CLOT|nr:hypothetical protein [Clostridium hominis]MBC5631031.1 hypothetical protein [Clostridium hominis]MDU2672673.1 hypothetical protein [Clostridium sp.]
MRKLVKIYIKTFKLIRRINKLSKANKILFDEYENIANCNIDKRAMMLFCMKKINKYNMELISEWESLIEMR